MQSRSIVIKIFYWVEVILSARILLFTLPVLLNGTTAGTFSFEKPDDWLIITLTVLGIYYLVLGVMAILGRQGIRAGHVIGLILIVGLSAVLWKEVAQTEGAQFEAYDFIPVFLAILFFVSVFTFGAPAALAKVKMKWKSILVIDDDETLIRTVRPILMTNGYSVLTSNTGEEGLRVAAAQQPDLILLDVIMPGLKGREVCLKLKKDQRTKQIPVIFLTAKDSQDDIDAELEAGAQAHLTKPVHRESLLATVDRILHET